MSRRADAPQCGGVVVEFESDEIRDARKKKARSVTGKATINPAENKYQCWLQDKVTQMCFL